MDLNTIVSIVIGLGGAIVGAVGAYITIKIKLSNGDLRMGSHSERIKKEEENNRALEKRVVELEKTDSIQSALLSRLESGLNDVKAGIGNVHDKLDRLIERI